MGFDFEKQKELAIAGFIAPFIGLLFSAIIHILDTVSADQVGLYNCFIWAIVLLFDILALLGDIKSILVNGPIYAVCFGISICLLNGINIKTFIGLLLSAVLVCCIIGAASIIMRSRE